MATKDTAKTPSTDAAKDGSKEVAKTDATVKVEHIDPTVKKVRLVVNNIVVEFRDGVAEVKADFAKELKKLGFVK